MRITRRLFCSVIITAPAIAGTGLSDAIAQDYPIKPVRLIVPYAAGGGTDAIARMVGQGFSERLKKTMVVENIGTAGGNLATKQAASARPDGYTVLMANQGPMTVNPHVFKNVGVDPLTAFDPVTLITSVPLVVVVHQDSPFKTLRDLVEHAQKNPGKVTYGSAGNGSASHLATVLLARMAKLELVHVPYRGAGPALTDILGRSTDFMITTLPSALGMLTSEKLRPLAVTTATRTKKFPNIPTVAESGWEGYDTGAWYGFVVPKGTPKEIIAKLREVKIETINSPMVRARLEEEGGEPIGSTPEEFAAMMKAESDRWAQVVKDANITIE